MRTEISKLHQNLQTTFIYVTHDQTEALTMGTRIVVMKDGFIQQIDSPQELYDHPVNMFVAGFIGSPQMNFANVTIIKEGEKVYLQFGEYKLEVPADRAKVIEQAGYIGKEVIFGIRPENTHDEPEHLEKWPNSTVDAKVEVTEMLGSETYLYLIINGVNFTARVHPKSKTVTGDTIKIAFEMSSMHLFDKETEEVIIN
jgi:multiple sugar transport system ATP-binding protein